MQRHQSILNGQTGLEIACQSGVLERGTQLRRNIRRHRNTPVAAMRVKPKRRSIFRRKLQKVRAARSALLGNPRHIRRRILHADDPRQLRQFPHRFRAHIDHRAWWNVVNDDRNIRSIVHRFEMRIKPGLRRTVVIRRHHQNRIRSNLRGMLRQTHTFSGVVRSGSGNHWNPPSSRFHHSFDHRVMLGMAQRRAFPCRAHRNKAFRTLSNVPLNKALQRVKIHFAIVKWSNKRRHRPS